MRTAAHFRPLCYHLLILLALIVPAASCHAVSMSVEVGFGGVEKTCYWTPIAVKMVNSSDENLDGVLVINQPRGYRQQTLICTAKVVLPAHSTKLYHACIRPSDYGGKINVTLAKGYGVLATRDININPAPTDDRLIATLGDRTARLSFMQGETIQVPAKPNPYGGTSGPQQATIHAGALSADMLPDRPAAYEGADVIVLSGLNPDSANPSSLKAICMWVAAGGTLVVPTGPDYRAFQNAFYDELLPVKIQGAANLPGMASLVTQGGVPFPAGPAAVAKSALKPGIGNIVLSEGGVPIIAERQYGAGRVVFLAFDLRASPFKDWNGQTQFWKEIIAGSNQKPFVETDQSLVDQYRGGYQPPGANAGFAEIVMQQPDIQMPSTSLIGAFLILYLIILVPVNYFVLSKKRRLELAWVSTPAIVILFTVGAYAIGYTMKGGQLRLTEATVIEASSNARYARMVTDTSVFSPARRSYDLTVANPYAVAQVVEADEAHKPPVVYLGETSTIEDVDIPMWSSKTFQAVGGTDLGGSLESNLKLKGRVIEGTIKNNTSINMKDCVVFAGAARVQLGALNKGAVRSVRIELGRAMGSQGGPPPSYGPGSTVGPRLYDFIRDKAQATPMPVLVGFAESGDGVVGTPDGRPVADRATCCVFHLSYSDLNAPAPTQVPAAVKAPRGGGPLVFTTEMVTAREFGLPPGVSQGRGGKMECDATPGSEYKCVYTLPLPPGYKVTELRVTGSTNFPSGTPGVTDAAAKVMNCQKGAYDRVSIPYRQSLPNPGDYVNAKNEVLVRIVGYAPGGKPNHVRCGLAGIATRP